MGIFDDIQNFANNSVGGAKQSIFSFQNELDGQFDALVKVVAGDKKGVEKTAAQIAGGEVSTAPPIASTAGQRVRRDTEQGDPLQSSGILAKYPFLKPVGIGVAIFAVGMLFLKARR